MISFKKEILLVISPHPDDEVLGCGGLIKQIKDGGGKVYVLFLTVGHTNDYSKKGESTCDERIKEIENVASYLGYDGYRIVFQGNDYHLRLDNIPQKDLLHEIENGKDISLNKIKPTIIATPNLLDYNQDHRAATKAIFAATRPAPSTIKPLQKIVLGYESVPTADWWHNSPYNPNLFITLSKKDLDAKITALKLYQSQVRTGAHPRAIQSIKNLAYMRGLLAGARRAEAFFSYRIII